MVLTKISFSAGVGEPGLADSPSSTGGNFGGPDGVSVCLGINKNSIETI